MSSAQVDEPPTGPLTATQVACLVTYVGSICLWVYSEYLADGRRRRMHAHAGHESQQLLVVVEENGVANGTSTNGLNGVNGAASPAGNSGVQRKESKEVPLSPSGGKAGSGSSTGSVSSSAFYRCLMLEEEALVQSRDVLRAAVEFGTLVLWFYVADRTSLIAPGQKSYTRDLFLFLFLALTCVAGGYSLKPSRATVLLNRQQTEEWKGWMQVLFLLYHYYNAKEVYNAIRVFIAAYVWMTGFGNFAYYYKTSDFSLGRFCQMMWRLNFLVFFCCLALNNSYMLYYICPMHTLFTIMVYGALAIGSRFNKSTAGIWVKIAASFAVVILVWEFKPVFYSIWRPFQFMMGYDDPRRPTGDLLKEWYFRSGLDRYIWIYGMVCAALHPTFDKLLQAIDSMEAKRRRLTRAVVIAAALGVGLVWYHQVYTLPKTQYNELHPYTSWIPITVFIVLRNMTPPLRTWSMSLYGWLGCITLETYIGQFHTWLLTKRADGQPIYLLTLLPGYPLLNFALVTAVYVVVSKRLFDTTNALKERLVPHDDNALLLRNGLMMGAVGAALVSASWVLVQARDLLAL